MDTAHDPIPTLPRLLLVDDDALLRETAAATLRHAGFDVTGCASGEAALQALAEHSFDGVLLDVVMTGIDGFDTCRRLRQVPATAELPVLMMTGLADTDSIDEAYRAGATDFITKPIHWGLLAHRVRYVLRAAGARSALLKSREQLQRAQRLAAMGSWAMHADGRMSCSDELARLLGRPDDLAGTCSAAAFGERVVPRDRQRVRRAREAALRQGRPYRLQFEIERFDGQRRSVVEHGAPQRDAHGRIVAIEGITQDITERAEAQREARRLALYDALTGLPNRPFFLDLTSHAIEQARREGTRCALLHLDLDRFKTVNDALGRAAGDRVLCTVAQRLKAATRRSDLTGSSAGTGTEVVARIGANGFTLLLLGIGQDADAGAAAERLIRELRRPIVVDGREVVLGASVGIALYPRDAEGAAELSAQAEQALYAAKRDGRGQHRFFDEGMNLEARERLLKEGALRHAIDDGQLVLHFQPKVLTSAGTAAGAAALAGVEALVRWQHPERGLVLPGEFIALAEETGLIGPLTDWVLDAACRALVGWREAGLQTVPVAVNVAGPLFLDPDFAARLARLTERHGIGPDALVLEVTESILMTDADLAVERLSELRRLGWRLSLDDFGTGYSSLSYLKRFPLDELKIDRSFVRDLAQGGRDRALVDAIVTMARGLGLRVVAEGVETDAQARVLRELGCDCHQGWLYARAEPADAVARRLPPAPPARHGQRSAA